MTDHSRDRLRYRFDLLDTDGNQVLEHKDFETLAQHVISAFGAAPDSAKAQAVTVAHENYWAGLVAALDANGDGKVDFDEYSTTAHKPEWFGSFIEPYAQSLADIADVDDDGYVEKADFIKGLGALGFSTDNAAQAFALGDTDGDGKVATSEWVAMIRDFYTSEDDDRAKPATALVS